MMSSDFDFDLPPEYIAQTPLETRSASRLLVMGRQTGVLNHKQFVDLPSFLRSGDLLVFNDTKVLPARLFGTRSTGGRIEMLLERFIDGHSHALVALRSSKSPKVGETLHCEGGLKAEVLGRRGEWTEIRFTGVSDPLEVIEAVGHVPLPPYIKRPDTSADRARYQTIYAREPGAVAAPTAGLHFDAPLFATLAAQGVVCAYVTLHVGAGTFRPVREETLATERLHAEFVRLEAPCVAAIEAARKRGARVIAVGTTTARVLETVAQSGPLRPFSGDTDIFIRPGFEFRVIDGLVTNFHLPKSTLLMMVAAFGGVHSIMHAYREAVAMKYRFFSYGDAMLII